ncbi:MAG TPA: outer membrane beta-barrel protein [Pseudolabrys sp.]|nr:outer membrane beta-barrel protein [Pseudolabrys sp.]
MKKVLLASAAVVASGAALAADLPTKAPLPARVAPFSWSGCYIGVHAGAGWSRTDFGDAPGFSFIAPVGQVVEVDSGTSFVGGGQVGCDYQFASNWVIGLAGDFSWADIDGQAVDPFFAGKTVGVPLTVHSRTDFLASATGRLGYAWDRYLIYAKGGVAWSHNKYDVNNFNCFIFVSCYSNASDTSVGWTAGAGFEWSFAPNWSVLFEYAHYEFGTNSLTFTDPSNGRSNIFTVNTDIDVVKMGVNYRFGGLLR